jgi:hypothetical protein
MSLRLVHCAVFMLSIAFACDLPIANAQADDAQAIFDHMNQLKSLVGTWSAVAEFHQKEGSISTDIGTYKISSVLEDTYLQWDVVLYPKENPKKQHSFWMLVTYSPVTHKYDGTYFYSRWALRVTETGEYDDSTKEFRTTAFIPLEDGVHDENVRTITKLGDRNKIVYQHYSRYNNEDSERMDVVITLTRVH